MRLKALSKVNIRRVRAGIIALALVCVCLLGLLPPARAEADGMIRVKLTRLGAPEKIVMSVDCDYYLSSDPSVRIASGDEVTIEASGSTLVMNAGKNRFRLGDTAKLRFMSLLRRMW